MMFNFGETRLPLVGIPWCSIILTLFGSWVLLNRSLLRAHDYVYAAVGAGALISLPIMIGVLCGLTFGQSLSGATCGVMSKFQPTNAADREHPKLPDSQFN